MIPLGMVSKKRISDCIVCVEDTRQKAEDKFYNKRWNEGPHHKFEGYVAPTFPEGRPLKHKYTDKTEHQREDSWHLIKQCQVAYVLPGLCWAAVGANFKALYYADLIPEQYPWILLTIVGVSFFGCWGLLYLLKCFMYPRRVLKDFDHKVNRYMFAGIPIALLLFGFAAQKEQDDIAEALFWLGSMSNLVLTFWLLTRTFIHPVSSSEVNPSMMIPLLGNLLAAYSTEQWLDKKGFMDLAFFLFTPSFILWLLLAPGILLRLTDAPALAPKVRITVFSYVAAPALSAACYLILVKEMDIVFLGLFFFSVFAELLMVALFLTNYFKAPFEEGKWFSVFCLAAATFPLISFHVSRDTSFTYVWLMAHFAVVTGLALILSGHTLANILHQKWFRGYPKYGLSPLAFTRPTHDAFRTAGKKILDLVEKLQDDHFQNDEDRKECQNELVMMLEGYTTSLYVHSMYEDNVLFPTVDLYLPGRMKTAEMQHEQIHHDEEAIKAFLREIKGDITKGQGNTGKQKKATEEVKYEESKGLVAKSAKDESIEVKNSENSTSSSKDAIAQLVEILPRFIQGNNEHMRHEEDHISHVVKKLIPSKEQKSIARKCLRTGTAEQWRVLLPFIITHQDYHDRRVKILQAFRVAYPERMQLFGSWLYLGVEEILFQRLRADIPELAPRNTEGWYRLW
mmetsp:Transcript_9038/g.17186  ORF Transcript_9038/g.17186 Transcript_9038/m.17186 type:complete len:680 (+) Transcript_9038:613-2652(+)